MNCVEDCNVCGGADHVTECCPELASDNGASAYTQPITSLARQTLPQQFDVTGIGAECDVISKDMIAARTRFGPLVARACHEPVTDSQNKLQLEVLNKDGGIAYLCLSNENECNWLSLIRPASCLAEQNCIAYPLNNSIYYSTTRDILSGEAMRVWYAKGYARKLNQPLAPSAVADQTHHCADEMAEIVGQNVAAFEEAEHNAEEFIARHMPGHQSALDQTRGVSEGIVEPPGLVDQSHPSSQSMNTKTSQRQQRDIIEQSIVDSQAFDITENEDLEMLERRLLYTCHLCPDVTCNGQQELDDHLAAHEQTTKQPSVGAEPDSQSSIVVTEATKRNTSFQCSKCPYKTSTSAALALHVTSEHLSNESTDDPDLPVPAKKRVWTCMHCGVVFSNPRSLGVHKKIHHAKPVKEVQVETTMTDPVDEVKDDAHVINVIIETEAAPPEEKRQYGRGKRRRTKRVNADLVSLDSMHDCPYCNAMYSTEEELKQHMASLHSFTCDKCSIKFGSATACVKHQCRGSMLVIDISAYITNIDNGTSCYTCLCCSQNFTDPKEFHDHLVSQGTNLQCAVCNGRYKTVEELEEHVITCTGVSGTSGGEESPSHVCSQCDVLLVDERALQAHLDMHSSFKCNTCQAQYRSRYGLQKHLLRCDQSQLGRVEPVFACMICDSVFVTRHGLEYHDIEHADVTFNCKECQASFSTQDEFESHGCCKEDQHCCDICQETFKTSKALASHYHSHTLNFTCPICQMRFDKKDELISHSLECSAKDMLDKTGRIDCALCKQSFTDALEYKLHLNSHTQYHECRHCNRRFRKKQQLNLHVNRCPLKGDSLRRKSKSLGRSVHYAHISSEIHYTCPICSKMFVRKDYYLNHECRGEDGRLLPRPDHLQLLDDTVPKSTFSCYQCGKIFSTQSNLTKHLKLHGEKDYVCEVCGRTFHQVHAMRLHYDTVHTNKMKVSCEHCKRIFRNKYSLNQHIKQFHMDNIAIYACEICGKKFRQKGNMSKHMLAHDTTKHYRCTCCDKTFKYPEQLKRHMLMHTHGKPLACHLCDRRFVVQYELNRHLKEMHSNKLYACSLCTETCRWRHTMRRHIKRKHPEFSDMVENAAYMTSLQKDACPVVDGMVVDGNVNSSSAPLVISVDTLTSGQMVELDEEQIASTDDGSIIQLYTEPGDLQISDMGKQLPNQQLVKNNTQHFTINLFNGQAILTQVNLDDNRVNTSSLLRSQVSTDVDSLSSQPGNQVVVGDEVTLPENAVLLSNDDNIAYNGEVRQEETTTVNFADISHIADNSQDGNKMMYFNIVPPSSDTVVTQ